MSRANKIRHIEWHETCKCKCRLDASVCNSKQRWNNDKCRCECIELIGKGICDKEFVWNPNNCECKCDKSCDVGEYLDYENFNCKKRLIDKLVDECSENIDGNEMTNISLSGYKNVFGSCIIYIVLLAIFLVMSISISSVFVFFFLLLKWY